MDNKPCVNWTCVRLNPAIFSLILSGVVAIGCGANQSSNLDPLPPKPEASAAHAAPNAPKASASPSAEPEANQKPPAKEAIAPTDASTDGLLGVESEPPPDKPVEVGFGPPEGSSAEYGMVNLLARPPSKAPKRRAK